MSGFECNASVFRHIGLVMNLDSLTIIAVVVTVVSSIGLMIMQLLNHDDDRADDRLERMTLDIVNDGPRVFPQKKQVSASNRIKNTLPRIASCLLPASDAKRTRLKDRLSHAGFYSPFALSAFVTIKMLMMVVLPVVGLVSASVGQPKTKVGLLAGVGVGLAGFILPGLWLDRRKTKRQRILRRALPDYLDLIIACLGSGLSIDGAIHKVAEELENVHPDFNLEMRLMEQEMKLGRSRNEAFLRCAERTDLDELRSLGLVFKQASEVGSSVAELLRVHSDASRTQREHRAEELAQKASVKILIPTLLFIFPAMFVVLIGPAVMQIKHLLLDVN